MTHAADIFFSIEAKFYPPKFSTCRGNFQIHTFLSADRVFFRHKKSLNPLDLSFLRPHESS
jgi:hypothetical protein